VGERHVDGGDLRGDRLNGVHHGLDRVEGDLLALADDGQELVLQFLLSGAGHLLLPPCWLLLLTLPTIACHGMQTCLIYFAAGRGGSAGAVALRRGLGVGGGGLRRGLGGGGLGLGLGGGRLRRGLGGRGLGSGGRRGLGVGDRDRLRRARG